MGLKLMNALSPLLDGMELYGLLAGHGGIDKYAASLHAPLDHCCSELLSREAPAEVTFPEERRGCAGN